MMPRFIYVNGEIFLSENYQSIPEIFLSPGFRLTDYIWFCNGAIPSLSEHLQRLSEQAKELRLNLPALFADQNEIQRQWLRLINKNKAFHSGVLFLNLIWLDGSIEAIVTLEPYDDDNIEIIKEGCIAVVSENIKFSGNTFGPMGFYSRNFWQAVKMSKPNADGLIITNENGEIVEFAGGNIFFIKENSLLTPSAESGCWQLPWRNKIVEAASLIGLKTLETKALNKTNIAVMEEAFVLTEKCKILKLTGIGVKRYTHVLTAEIVMKLNRILLGR
jgi:branched-subunit amino acid aminotransferase/4-amino-4-deoxychorismate lyase